MDGFWLQRVPWGKFFLLWFLAILMAACLLWLHYAFSAPMLPPLEIFSAASGLGLLWATSRPRWKKAYCAWCGAKVQAKEMRINEKGTLFIFVCGACGHVTEKQLVPDGSHAV